MIVRTSLRSSLAAMAVILLCSASVLAQAPDEVTELAWCPGTADCLFWSPVAAADAYTLYRGDLAGVRGLLDDASDPCIAGGFVETTTGALIGDPAPAGGHWYLVAATNASGAGGTGNGSDGPRIVEAAGTCGGTVGALTLNEIDYDQSGADTDEFIEVFNAGTATADLTGVAIVFVNGNNQSEYGRVDLSVVGSLPPGGFLVVGASTVLTGLPTGVPGLPLPTSLQNGAPDGVALFDAVTETLLDALSYEGEIRAAVFNGVDGTFDLVEGEATAAADTGDGALARFPDGRDTDDAAGDWSSVVTPTPGTANAAE